MSLQVRSSLAPSEASQKEPGTVSSRGTAASEEPLAHAELRGALRQLKAALARRAARLRAAVQNSQEAEARAAELQRQLSALQQVRHNSRGLLDVVLSCPSRFLNEKKPAVEQPAANLNGRQLCR